MREQLSMDFGWRFHFGEIEQPEITEFNYYYNHTKAESARGPAAPSYYDMDWEWVDLPHDYGLYELPDQTYTSAFGFYRRKNAWYRKLFSLSREDMGKRLVIQFDGVATWCTVWVNGHLLKRNFCGYTSFLVDITDVAEYGDMLNLIAVHVDTSQFEGWWYEGAGIYRHVSLIKTAQTAVEPWGVFVRPLLGENGWTVKTETRIHNGKEHGTELAVRSTVEKEGEKKGTQENILMIESRSSDVLNQEIAVERPLLWDVEHPHLYQLKTEILENGKTVDCCITEFGFRSIEFHPQKGFLLNGRAVKLKGVCAHEDQANLGVALPDGIREERMKRLKELGCNAYRCSHNPPAPETLSLCDRLGLLVIDENRWFDSSEEGIRQLESMIRRDRNHPSIILWSMANEEPLQGCEKGRRIMNTLRAAARKLDESRPVMMAMHNGLQSSGAAASSDVIGINYNEDLYDEVHARFPNTALVASEIGGKLSETGIMGDASGEDWEAVNTRPYMAGMFKWAAYGYRGEARAWPRVFSRSGIIEANGDWKENSWFYRSMWRKDRFTKIYPEHWNLKGKEQEYTEVRVYTSADEVEMWLNGRLIGMRKVNPYRRTIFFVPYEPGELRAIAKKDGKIHSEDAIFTTQAAYRLRLKANKDEIKANRRDVVTVTATAEDEKGRQVLWEERQIRFLVDGDVTVLAVQNSDPYEHRAPKDLSRKLYHGSCQLVIRANGVPGNCLISAVSEGLESASLTLEVVRAQIEPHVDTELFTDSLVYFAKMSGQN